MTFNVRPDIGHTDDGVTLADISRDEHPWVVTRDIARRRRPDAHIIAFANEKGGVGKSTLAFNTALALAHLGHRVLAVDCDRRQQTLHGLLDARDGTARALGIDLPRPVHITLRQQNAAQLLQEIARTGQTADYIIIDMAGQDSPLLRRVIALANTVVTPMNCSHADMNLLGRISPVNRQFTGSGPFGETVRNLIAERATQGQPPMDWIVARNRVRRSEQRLIATVDQDLATMSGPLGYRVINGLTERIAYRELLPFGLSYQDLKLLPGFGVARSEHLRELRSLVEDLQLPAITEGGAQVRRTLRPAAAPVTQRCALRYRDALATVRPIATMAS